MRWIDPPTPPDRQLWAALAGKAEPIRMLYETLVGAGAGKGIGWIPMLCEVVRRTRKAAG